MFFKTNNNLEQFKKKLSSNGINCHTNSESVKEEM